MTGRQDTIFALATPPGRSAIAVIRISGPAAHAALALFGAACPAPGRFQVARLLDDNGMPLDEALILAMAGPRSSTGEDVVEIHTHGSVAVTAAALRMLGDAGGFRPAIAGEFTHRTFANGKVDLLATEALADLIDSETDRQRLQAWRQLDGALYKPVTQWREELVRLGGRLEALIDFADEDLPPSLEAQLRSDSKALIHKIEAVLDDGRVGEQVRSGVTVSLLGPVNAGKSTLLNVLVGRNAAIVSDEAGTTRDVVSARLEINGVPVTLLDTAGVRQTGDLIEAEGVRRAVEAARGASASLIVLDGSDASWPEALESLRGIAGPSHVVILNKCDLMHEAAMAAAAETGALTVSLVEGTGLETVAGCLRDLVVPANWAEGSSLITRERHRTALEDTVASLEALLGYDFVMAPELAAEDYRRAADSLGRITGQIDAEELLGSIFSSFCIGK